jgi:ComF family protein
MVNNFLHRLEYLLLPGQCLLCGAASHRQLDLCQPCQDELPWLEHYCPSCALPLSPDALGHDCGRCLLHPPQFRQVIAPWQYQPPLSGLLNGFKHHRDYAAGRVLGELSGAYIDAFYQDQVRPDLITYTPLHWWRQWRRSFNQSQRLAQQLSHRTGIPIKPLLKRQRATQQQQGLNARQRQRNLKGAFRAGSGIKLNGETVALVDDVVTTTATAAEMTRVLLAMGAAAVDIWCLARTPKPDN